MSNHPVFTEIKENDNSKEYINISIEIGYEGKIYYGLHNDDNHKFNRQYTEKYNDIIHISLLISKILYYHPALDIHDVDCIPIIILENSEIELDWNREKSIGRNVILNMKNYIFKNIYIFKYFNVSHIRCLPANIQSFLILGILGKNVLPLLS